MAWPSSLPQTFEVKGYNETPPDLFIRSKVDQGPDKVRKGFTAGVTSISGNMTLTTAQIATLDAYYVSIVSDAWVHPRTGSNVTFRFTQPPVYTSIGNGYYVANISIEILP